jgi:GNAT superfamily N-acetyltransferase
MSWIRSATTQDLPRVWELIRALAEYEHLTHTVTGTEAELRKWLFEKPVASCLVCECEQGIVGYAIYFTTFSTFGVLPGIWLEDVFVLPEHRGRGFGKQLIRAVIQEGRDRGFGRVEWSVLDWNESAIEFYRAIGADVLPDWRICRIRLASHSPA